MAGTANSHKDEYIFKKLQGSHNYKQWIQDISFALKEARLWWHVKRTTITPLLLCQKEMIIKIEWKVFTLVMRRSVNSRTMLIKQ